MDLEVGYMFVLEDASLSADAWRDELGLLALVLIPVQLTSLRLLRKVIRRLVLHIHIFYVYIYIPILNFYRTINKLQKI